MDTGPAQRQEFRVVIRGVSLSAEQREQLNHAVQQATLHVMARIDFKGDQTAIAIPDMNGGTQGIQYVVVDRGVADRLVTGDF